MSTYRVAAQVEVSNCVGAFFRDGRAESKLERLALCFSGDAPLGRTQGVSLFPAL